MIKLENVSIYGFLERLEKENKYLYEMLLINDVFDLNSLEWFLTNNKNQLNEKDYNYLSMFFNEMYIKASLNEKIEYNSYLLKEIETDKKIKYTDSLVRCDKLPIFSPITYYPLEAKASRITINDAKNMLDKVVIGKKRNNVENALKNYLKIKSEDEMLKIVNGINMYNEQLLRQSLETPNNVDNLFTYNQQEKREIIESELDEIVNYLITNADTCIWGKVLQLPLISMINIYRENDSARRERLINCLANYTTLGEIEHGFVKSKVLDKRFITKRR